MAALLRAQDISGPAQFKMFIGAMRLAFPDIHVTADDIVVDGDRVALRFSATATHKGEWLGLKPTGKKTVQHLCAICRFQDGLMTEETVYYDQLERIRQIGEALVVDGQALTLPKKAS